MKRQTEKFDSQRRDRETIAAVRHRIEHSRNKALRRVKAKISEGTIILSGPVPTEDDVEVAIALVRTVNHVERVIDEMEVLESFDESRESLAGDLNRSLEKDF